MKRNLWKLLASVALCGTLLSACAAEESGWEESVPTYEQISEAEAKKMMDSVANLVILDVRRQEEFDLGHIPGAICIPNETIDASVHEILTDLNQTILVYCRSGRRSKEAAQKLANLGYTNIREFGGILTWTFGTTTEA